MKAVGVVVEYNPFHNGHHLHVQEARKQTEAEVVVAVMSGPFLQRGEPALVNKWARTSMALQAGVDLVIELPYTFATQKAEIFAHGALSILQALKCDSVCFGSEDGNISSFLDLVDFHRKNKAALDAAIRVEIKKGVSYPRAAASAFHSLKEDRLLDLSLPNNILGFHYVKAIVENQLAMKPVTIARTKAHYHDASPNDASIASATTIRKMLTEKRGQLAMVQQYVPATTYALLQQTYKKYAQFTTWEHLFPYLKFKLLTTGNGELRTIYEIEEGIEHRLKDKVKEATSFQSFLKKVKTKRFTWTRLQRMCTHIVTNTKKTDMLEALERKEARYIRLLGMSETGRLYLNRIKKRISLPLISKFSRHTQPLLATDEKASLTYAMAYPTPIKEKIINEEYMKPPIIYS